MSTYQQGYTDGKREAARLLLDALADHVQATSGRLTGVPTAVAAANEATAILRDAARALDWTPPEAEAAQDPTAQLAVLARTLDPEGTNPTLQRAFAQIADAHDVDGPRPLANDPDAGEAVEVDRPAWPERQGRPAEASAAVGERGEPRPVAAQRGGGEG